MLCASRQSGQARTRKGQNTWCSMKAHIRHVINGGAYCKVEHASWYAGTFRVRAFPHIMQPEAQVRRSASRALTPSGHSLWNNVSLCCCLAHVERWFAAQAASQ